MHQRDTLSQERTPSPYSPTEYLFRIDSNLHFPSVYAENHLLWIPAERSVFCAQMPTSDESYIP